MSSADLASWLLEQIAEDEREARNLDDAYRRDEVRPPARLVNHNALVIPARVLAECEAKKKIIEKHHKRGAFSGDCAVCLEAAYLECLIMVDYPCDTLRLLALPYADRPGYQEKWKP